MVSERETSKNMIRKAGYMVHSMMGGSSGKLAREYRSRWQVAVVAQSSIEKTTIRDSKETRGGEYEGVNFASRSYSPETQASQQKWNQHMGRTAASLWGPL